jgi:hypothetical protein
MTTKHPLYAIKMMHDGRERTTLSLSRELPSDVPNFTLSNEQIGNMTAYLAAREIGRVEVPSCFGSSVSPDGRLELSSGGQTWVYAASDLEIETGAVTTGGGNRPVVIRIPAHRNV